MEIHHVRFITILTIFTVALFCILRTSTVSTMEATAVTNLSVAVSDSPLALLPYSDQQQVHQEPFHPITSLLERILMNLDGFLEFPGVDAAAVNPSLSDDSASITTRKTNRWKRFICVGVFGAVVCSLLVLFSGIPADPARKRNQQIVNALHKLKDETHAEALLGCIFRNHQPAPADQGVGESSSGIANNPSNLGGYYFTRLQLNLVTNNFDDLIKEGHSGNLFQGSLEDGTRLVVKMINLDPLKKESYKAELNFFKQTTTPHEKLLSLFGHCLHEENEKFLVYEYMSNGDLYTCLSSGPSLDWITRRKIAIGAAQGLVYLHDGCNPPLVHRDVQATSILLADGFEVRLGSLGKVCTAERGPRRNVITRWMNMCLKPGHVPSTSDSPSATSAYDVYCFGKILLGLVSGNLDTPTGTNVLEQLHIIKLETETVGKIVDNTLIIEGNQLEELWAMAILARACLNPVPSNRPLMRDVLQVLENPSLARRDYHKFN